MRKRMLRSVLVAALSAVVAFGALSGLSGAQDSGNTEGDTVWSTGGAGAGDGEDVAYFPADTVWS
ncbi:hypothetical protein AB0N20_17530 [Streptomyces griseoincarnatus]|uniref:5'-nucleotidase n=2 Tax=Streptomyces TaxID=1883 RepID=A0ABT0VUJ5_STRGI|nr:MULTISPECIES: hypothetical protein [Streptomyces]MCM2514877.1 hypothetical protein [Streptomyces griseoincarnatus]WPW20420.1 hypothetical protein UBV09_17760 [Streptomyces griseoincarnatus]